VLSVNTIQRIVLDSFVTALDRELSHFGNFLLNEKVWTSVKIHWTFCESFTPVKIECVPVGHVLNIHGDVIELTKILPSKRLHVPLPSEIRPFLFSSDVIRCNPHHQWNIVVNCRLTHCMVPFELYKSNLLFEVAHSFWQRTEALRARNRINTRRNLMLIPKFEVFLKRFMRNW